MTQQDETARANPNALLQVVHNVNSLNGVSSVTRFTNNVYLSTIEQIKANLYAGVADTAMEFNLESNRQNVHHYQECFNAIIPFKVPDVKKLIKPNIPRIEVQKNDTAELKKLIRKFNIKSQSFTCDHTKQDKQFDQVESQIGKIFLSSEYKTYSSFIETLSSYIYAIHSSDEKGKQNNECNDNVLPSEIEKVNRAVISINNQLIEIGASYKSLTCARCDHIRLEYEETIRTVNEIREEIAEEFELASQEPIAEDNYSVQKFIQKNYPTMNRIPLRDICIKYKNEFGIKKTLAEMKTELEKIGFQVVCNHHKFFVKRVC